MCFVFILHEITNLPSPNWLDNSAGRALNLYRRRHGFESRSCLIFFRLSPSQRLKLRSLLWLSFIYTSLIQFFTSVRDVATRQTRNPSLDCFSKSLKCVACIFLFLFRLFRLCKISIFIYSYFMLSYMLSVGFNVVPVIVPVVSVVLIAVLIAVFFYLRR